VAGAAAGEFNLYSGWLINADFDWDAQSCLGKRWVKIYFTAGGIGGGGPQRGGEQKKKSLLNLQ